MRTTKLARPIAALLLLLHRSTVTCAASSVTLPTGRRIRPSVANLLLIHPPAIQLRPFLSRPNHTGEFR